MYHGIFFLHLIAATLWTGGHIILTTCVLPRALRERDAQILLDFESAYERIGMPALVFQVFSGLWLAHTIVPDTSLWFTAWLGSDNALARLVSYKLILLIVTAAIALHTRYTLVPQLNATTLKRMAKRIYAVTALSILLVLVGVSFRGGLLA